LELINQNFLEFQVLNISLQNLTLGNIYFLLENFWKDAQNKRNFFVNYARDSGFDPLMPNNWYKLQLDQLANANV
jgi:hypothetical protein